MATSSNNLPVPMQQVIKDMAIDPAKCNLMVPTESYGRIIGKYERMTLEVIRLDPDARNGADLYPISGKVAPTKVALLKISHAMGIQWDMDRCRIVERTATVSRARAVGALKMPNGEWVVFADEKTVDLDVVRDEEARAVDKDITGGKVKAERREAEIERRVLQIWKFRDELAMTGAKTRVIRALVAMPASFPPAMAQKPFVFPRITVDMDKLAADPQMREAALRRLNDTAGAVFGSDAAASPEGVPSDAPQLEAPEDRGDEERRDDVPDEREPEVRGDVDDDIPPSTVVEEPPAEADGPSDAEAAEAAKLLKWIEEHERHEKFNDAQRAWVKKWLDRGMSLPEMRRVQKQMKSVIGGKA